MSAMSETSENLASGSDRESELMEIILKTRIAFLLPVAGTEENQEALRVWDEILADVPTHWLNQSFVLAMRAHDARRPFGAPLVLKVYRELVANGTVSTTERRQRGTDPDEPPCEFCNNTGWRYTGPERQKRKWNEIHGGDRVTKCEHAK